MAGFGEQIEASRVSHLAVRALEESVRRQISEAFFAWDGGEETPQSIRWRLEAIIRDGYRSAAAVGVAHVAAQAGIPGWRPVGVFRTSYLDGLLSDVRRNLREYKASDRGDVARRRAISRIQHSAGVAATRGYTDAVLESSRELEDFGFRLRKLWVANFINNSPCEFCAALHGTEVGLDEDFPTDVNKLKIYGDLKGPPRHPRCKCRLVILHVRFDNFFDTFDLDEPVANDNDTITTDEVQAMPVSLFGFLSRGLRRLIRYLRGRP
ncbi:hypothetical protein SEA_MAGRITTE_15 [Microbacterium phage Magritte]|nr:hypothetical protein SEA_MAGRITTE_15 [Microbacterium phage Magritte]